MAQDKADFVSIFDGQSLAGWRGYQVKEVPPGWTVDDGAILGSGEGPDLMTKQQYGDFELQFEWRIAQGGNSGVIYRVQEHDAEKAHHIGIEFQILDDVSFGKDVNPAKSTGAIYAMYGDLENKTLRPPGEYNTSQIVARGNRLEHRLNDEVVAEGVVESPDWNQRVAASKFQAWPKFAKAKRGHIVLQAHGSKVWFKNLKIQELEPAE